MSSMADMAVLKIRLKVIGNVPRGHFLVLWRGSTSENVVTRGD